MSEKFQYDPDWQPPDPAADNPYGWGEAEDEDDPLWDMTPEQMRAAAEGARKLIQGGTDPARGGPTAYNRDPPGGGTALPF